MGNYFSGKLMGRKKGFSYIQSEYDIPCRVELDSLHTVLSFSKWDDEAFLFLRSDKGVFERGLKSASVTTGRGKHLYRILDSGRMEYDIVLFEKPVSPVIKIPLEFPEGLNFYKQGIKYSHLMREEVKGSYALYWKNRNNKYRTGKFCHIYRPEIFDSKGSRIWGELEFDGDSLYIIIDDKWLSGALYPVTVDPVIGTDTAGASHLNTEDSDPDEWFEYTYEMIMPVNPYTAPQDICGSCTAYYYSYYQDSEARGYPVLYSDSAGSPSLKISSNEVYADLRSPVSSGEWLGAGFDIAGSVSSGDTIWFGYMPRFYMYPYFDEGGSLKEMNVESYTTPPESFDTGGWSQYQITLSMYFEYPISQNHVRDIADSESISDGVSRKNNVKRIVGEVFLSVQESLSRVQELVRRFSEVDVFSDNLIRRAGVFLTLLSSLRVWDYLLNRKAKSMDELTIHSPVTVELEIDSDI